MANPKPRSALTENRALELTGVSYEDPAKVRYKVCVKVIDIFGNDTTRVLEVSV